MFFLWHRRAEAMTESRDTVAAEIRLMRRRALTKYSIPPLALLVSFLVGALPFSLVGVFNYIVVMPILLFILGILVMFIGAFWDFGAKLYVRDLVEHNLPFGDKDLDYIFKQQFILTSIYFGIGSLYLIAAFIIFLI